MVQVTIEKRRRRAAEVRNEKDRTVRILNVRLLSVSVVGVTLLAVLGYLRYENRLAYVADSFLNRAATMEEAKDWNQAGAYLRRYLRVNPADTEARVRLIQALEHSAVTRAQHRQLVALLYEILGLLPDRDDLRSKLAGQLLKIGDFSAAESEAGKLLSAESAADQCEARRVIAISMRARARRGGLVSLEQAAIALKKSLDDNPGDATIASLLAELYRANPDDVGVPNAASRADEIMDQLVAASPQDPGALLARYGYRRRHSLPEARQDLDTLLSQNPDHVDALLLAANEDYSSGAPNAREAAERKLLRAVELAPGDPRGYIALARIYSIGGDRKRAVEVLTDGRKKLESISLELDEIRSGLLIDLSHLEEADRSIAAVESEFRRRLPELPTIARRKQESVIRLLKGRLYFARNELEPAIAELNAVTASAEVPADVVAGSLERLQAHALLATIMGTMQRTDVAAAHWKVVAQSAPQFLDAGWKAGAAYLELGRPDEAIEQLERYVVLPSASPEAWNALVQSHLQKQMRLALADRNWSEFVATLKQAQQELPDRWELQFAEALYQIALDTEESKELATSLLRKIENNFSSDVEVWKRLALIYQQLASREDANRALARYEELETSVVSRMSLRAAILARNNQTEAASKLLLDALQTATPQERLELELTRAKLFLAARDPDAAQKIVSEIIAASQKAKPQALTLGIEIALMRRDFAAAKRWEEMLKVDSNADRFEWRYFRTRRLLGEYAHLDTDGRAELEQLIESLQSARPDWYPVIALVGRHAELKGETSKAVEAYELAIDCGDARPETMERLMSALYAEGRFSDANIYLARLKAERPTDPRIESMAILSAVKENRLDDALVTAKEAVSRGSDDPMHYVWYGNLLLLDGQQQTAEEVYQKAIERFPEDGRVWNGYFSFLVRSNQADEARHVLEDWPSKVGIDGAAKNSVLAQGYEALGDLAAAESLYRKSVEMDPRNSADRLRLAKMLLSTDATAARTEFEAILKTDPKNSEARRHLAAILAASGGADDWSRAVKLLESTTADDPTTEASIDDRLRAILLAQRGRNREERLRNYEAARQILLTRLSQSNEAGQDVDRMLLAGIYEQEWMLRDDLADTSSLLAIRDVMRPLVDRANPPVEYLIQVIEFCFRHLKDISTVSDEAARDDLREVLTSDAELRIGELASAVAEKRAKDQQFLPIAYQSRLLAIQHRDEEAQRMISEFAEAQLPLLKEDADRAKFYLQLGNLYASIGNHRQAEKSYRHLVTVAPNGYVLLAQSLFQQDRIGEAVDVCLEANDGKPSAQTATVLAQLLSSREADVESSQRADDLIQAALKADGKNVDLLMSVAVQMVTRDNSAEAIRLFRKVIEIDPDHMLALNNLATLLAEEPNQLAEARNYIERAIAVAGRTPSLLDTFGTILARSKKYAEATAVLEEAVAGVAMDPRYHFHLAVAYQGAGRDDDARSALETSREKGLEDAILTSGDREMLRSLEHGLSATSAAN